MSDDGPPLVRPIPRRPFDINFISPTPPSDNSAATSPRPDLDRPDLDQPRLLSPKPNGSAASSSSVAPPTSDSGSISRTQSIMNLTSSTLFGIYSPTSSFGMGRKAGIADREDLDTPWGTGSQTPVKRRTSIDESTFELMRDRSSFTRRRSSRPLPTPQPATAASFFFLVSRVALLFLLGMGYGALVTRLHHGDDLSGFKISTTETNFAWPSLMLWGVCGVVLGALLPWFDRVWADSFGADSGSEDAESEDDESRPATDWATVVRSIGAFVGIVFAIRRLPWASTLQVSLTLALVNPFLWYLIDRSKPGFLLSAAVGVTGSAVLLGVNPDMVPTPSGFLHHNSSASLGAHGEPLALGGFATQETLETGIWMLSVLFCSCVCFGNIGRRLALSKPSLTRGRWASVK